MSTALHRSLNHSVNHRLNRYAAVVANGGRRPRAKDGLLEICRYIEQSLKIRDRMAREDPHLFGPEARAYLRETVAEHDCALQVEAALAQVYGSDYDKHSSWADRVWSTAYPQFTSAAQKQKWIKKWSKFRNEMASLPR
ncbi:MAG: hypothetical protein QM813_12510 [Verrucomicrobiota bacterium]